MDFQLSDVQVDLGEATRGLCATKLAMDVVRSSLEQPHDRSVWAHLVEAGVFAVCRPEADGGLGLGVADAAVVHAELGRALAPGPTIWTSLAAGLTAPPPPHAVVGGVDLGREARLEDDLPAGTLVEHLGDLDLLLLLDGTGIHAVSPAGLDATSLRPLDPLTSVWALDGVGATELVGRAEEAQHWRRTGAVLAAAQLSGVAQRLAELSVTFAEERHQFGRPVGSFQAIKHTLADMWVRAELGRPQVLYAAAALDEDAPDAARAASAAKVVAGDAAIRNGHAAIQVHGGMGYTWEADPHLYLKRAWVLDNLFGSSDEHAELLAAGLGPATQQEAPAGA